MHVDTHTVPDASARLSFLGDGDPSWQCEVQSLRDVIPSVESRVVRCGSGDDELTGALHGASQFDPLFEQVLRVYQ